MVYTNIIRRTSSRLLSASQQQTRQSLLVSTPASTTISSAALPLTNNNLHHRTITSAAINTGFHAPQESFTGRSCVRNNNNNDIATRSKHSSTQVKRLFKQNPAKRRIALKQQKESGLTPDRGIVPEATLAPVVSDPIIFSNGWNPPLEEAVPEYPFRIARTKDKPYDAVGFLPVYSEHRKDGARVTTRIKKVTGDRELFLNELRAALEIPIPKNPKEDMIRIRTGGTIEIKGNRVLEVKKWLAGLGF